MDEMSVASESFLRIRRDVTFAISLNRSGFMWIDIEAEPPLRGGWDVVVMSEGGMPLWMGMGMGWDRIDRERVVRRDVAGM